MTDFITGDSNTLNNNIQKENMADKKISRRKFMQGTAASMLMGPAICQASKVKSFRVKKFEPFSFVVMADPQLFMNGETFSTNKLIQAVSHLNQLLPPFLMICGDLTHAAYDDPNVVHETNVFFDKFSQMNSLIKRYDVAGNHDTGAIPTYESIAWYEQRFAPIWYSFVYRNNLFIIMESNLLREPGNVPALADKQMLWFKDELKKSTRAKFCNVMLFMHHGLCLNNVNEADDGWNIGIVKRHEILALCHQYNVKAVFNGHRHLTRYVNDNGLEIVTSNASSYTFNTDGTDPVGLRLVDVYEDHIMHTFYDYSEMPTSLAFPVYT
ncbi:MAG: metallophosphoesterase [Planctomycetes bacterium]|nr:metallophosphoesterase [Planctomycetota bacterium]